TGGGEAAPLLDESWHRTMNNAVGVGAAVDVVQEVRNRLWRDVGEQLDFEIAQRGMKGDDRPGVQRQAIFQRFKSQAPPIDVCATSPGFEGTSKSVPKLFHVVRISVPTCPGKRQR